MKVLRFLGILLLLLVVAVLVLGLVAPKKATLEREIVIDAPKDVVFNQIADYHNWNHWSPWYEKDTAMTVTYKGSVGEPNSGYHWKTSGKGEDMGEGEMTTKGISGDSLLYNTHFIEPWESSADGYFKVEEVETGKTKVKWGFVGEESSYPFNVMNWFMDVFVGKDFEKGLQNLKTYVESGKAEAGSSNMTIKQVDFPAKTYAVIRKEMSWGEMEQFFNESYTKLGEAAGEKITGPASGIYYQWDEENQRTDVAAAFPVSGKGSEANGVTYTGVPASKAYMAVHKGGYSASYNTHMMLTEKVQKDGKQQRMVVEEYIKGPADTQDSTEYITNIYYLVN